MYRPIARGRKTVPVIMIIPGDSLLML